MLRTALALLSTLQIGARIKELLERSLRQAAVIAVAAVLLIAASIFGLIAAYQALVSIYQFDAGRGSGDHGGRSPGHRADRAGNRAVDGPPAESRLTAPPGSPRPPIPRAMIDQGVGKAMQQVGPVPLLVAAFLAGIFAGRR